MPEVWEGHLSFVNHNGFFLSVEYPGVLLRKDPASNKSLKPIVFIGFCPDYSVRVIKIF